jgi:D-glycero-D-manno-heptose 1,7-bisphosphate phosphatase
MKKAIFLDRDGVINKEINYLYRVKDLEIIKGVSKAIKIFNSLDYLVIVITNQAGVAKGYYSEEDVILLNRYIKEYFERKDSIINMFYYCPHHIEGTVKKYKKKCKCRKPGSGMIKKAQKEFDIDLKKSILVGDKETDILAGLNAGVKTKVLVRSGHEIDECNTNAEFVCDNLLSFAKIFLKIRRP